jgi:hypothetical protein
MGVTLAREPSLLERVPRALGAARPLDTLLPHILNARLR